MKKMLSSDGNFCARRVVFDRSRMLLQVSAFLSVSLLLGTRSLADGNLSMAATTKTAAAKLCEQNIAFGPWLEGVHQEALQNGVSEQAWSAAKNFLVLDAETLKRDRKQGVFQQSFLQFSDRMASLDRMKRAQNLIATTNKGLFDQIESVYGVPGAVISSLWALESDFGKVTGKFSILSSVTTLAYDCRRPEFFRGQLLYALKLVTRGDLRPEEMIGNWAGELGATQFMPKDYLESGVDFDRDGKVNLVVSTPDTLASVAKYFVQHGWQRSQPWLQEVSVPQELPWQEADPTIAHPISFWTRLGVKPVGVKFPNKDYDVSLILPMGRFGPAFFAYPNMQAFYAWNSSMVYSTTAAYLATRIAGARPVQRGNSNVEILTNEQVVELQNLLLARGFDIGQADGKIGSATRTAVKEMQMRFGLPADSYATVELIKRLKGQ